MTCSPRLSYFGLQAALAFYLINLQEFAVRTSLSVARDRVVGVLVGLFMMWLVFDQLWGTRAAVEMKKIFIYNLRLLADLAREPLPGAAGIWRTYSLRETISASFDKVKSVGDALLFELGPSREQGLALRSRIRRWQPSLRALFMIRTTLLKYRSHPKLCVWHNSRSTMSPPRYWKVWPTASTVNHRGEMTSSKIRSSNCSRPSDLAVRKDRKNRSQLNCRHFLLCLGTVSP